MNRSGTLRLVVVCALALMTLVGCSKGIEGRYEGDNMSINIKSGSKADVTIMGSTVESDYKVDGNKITFTVKGGPDLVLTHNSDDTLTGGAGVMPIKLTKKE